MSVFLLVLTWAWPCHAGAIDEFPISLEQTVSDGVPGPGAGNIEASGNIDRYTFTVAANTLVYFDEILPASCNIRWACTAPDSTVLFSNNPLCNTDPAVINLTQAGQYTIEVVGFNGATGTYSFILWEVNPVDEFAIDLKQVVADGAPGPGAGNIEEPGAVDRYTFDVSAGTLVYFDELAGSCNIRWSCYAPDATTVFSNNALCNTNPGTILLSQDGTYTIEVDSGISAAVGTYSFVLWQVNPVEQFTINLKQVVSDGVPAPGAGNIEEPGAIDRYIFDVNAGTVVYFDELSGSCSLRWKCIAPDSAVLFANNALCNNDPGTFTLGLGGSYTIEVDGGISSAVGTYSFTLWEVNAPDQFAIQIDQIVSPGVPGPGAGTIEEAGTMDAYTFSVDPGTQVFFDELAASNCGLDWRCRAPDGTLLFNNNALCVTDPGEFTLDQEGSYTIEVYGLGDATGTYSFELLGVNPTESFTIELEQVVARGVPGAGAGNIEEAGAVDLYTLTVDAGTLVFFDELAASSCGLQWRCIAPDGANVFNSNALCTTDPGVHLLAQAGDYTIRVFGQSDATGTYSFVVWEVNPPQQFTIVLDQLVTNGLPEPGAGNIEEPGAIDQYVLNLAQGDRVCFVELAGPCNLEWSCTGPGSIVLFDSQSLCGTDPGQFIIDVAGEYVITVQGQGDAVGAYSFMPRTGDAADITNDCQVGVADLLAVIAAWGPCADPQNCPEDVNGDGAVNVADLLAVISNWG